MEDKNTLEYYQKYEYYQEAIDKKGWFPEGDFYRYLFDEGYQIIEGKRHNRTDGEVHWIIKTPNEEEYELHANGWSAPTWQNVVNFVFKGKYEEPTEDGWIKIPNFIRRDAQDN